MINDVKKTLKDLGAETVPYVDLPNIDDTENNIHEEIEILCPVCHSNNILYEEIRKDNEIYGSRCYMRPLLSFYVCNDCGVMFKRVEKV